MFLRVAYMDACKKAILVKRKHKMFPDACKSSQLFDQERSQLSLKRQLLYSKLRLGDTNRCILHIYYVRENLLQAKSQQPDQSILHYSLLLGA
jgi:hypothetical protein